MMSAITPELEEAELELYIQANVEQQEQQQVREIVM